MIAKKISLIGFFAVALCSAAPATAAVNLIQDGDFSSPNENGSWANTTSPYWSNLAPYKSGTDGIEVGASTIYGLPCISSNCQNLEVNANVLGDVVQTVSGLVVGHEYHLTWDYGGRSGGGAQQLDVTFGGQLVATDTGSLGAWSYNSVWITATATSEVLGFASVNVGGTASYGNELTNVSLVAPGPTLAASWFVPALLLLARAASRNRRRRA